MKIDPLDELFSEYIRRRAIKNVGGCERCLTQKHDTEKEDGSIFPAWKQLQCSHYIGRAVKQVRWDEDNACGLCGGCHMYLTSQPEEHKEFFLNRIGQEKINLLEARRRESSKYIDKEAIKLYLKEKIRELKEE